MKNIKKTMCAALAAFTLVSGTALPDAFGINNPIAMIQEVSAASYSTGTYTVNTASGVNVRKGAGTGYAKVGAATNGTTFKVTQISGSWGYTSSISCTNGTKSGWVCLDYCKAAPVDVSVKAYANFQASYNYAKKYWNKANPAYPYYPGVNCANFVSQCLVAGGVKTDSTWKKGTNAFVNTQALKNYFTGKGIKYISKPSASQIKKGDVIYTNNGGHVMFVMRKSGNTIYASGNTNNRDELALSAGSIYGVLKTSALYK